MDAKKLYRIANAAAETGIARTTIQSAVERGEIKAVVTGCGLPLVTLADVKRWADKPRQMGRKPKADAAASR